MCFTGANLGGSPWLPLPCARLHCRRTSPLARRTQDANQARRLLALAAIYDGASLRCGTDWQRGPADRPRLGGALQRGGAGGADRPQGAGAAAALDDGQRRALAAMVESGPMPAVHGVVRWRLVDLAQWVWDEFRVAVSETRSAGNCARSATQTLRSATPSCPGPGAVEAIKKLPCPAGCSRAREGRRAGRHRGVVRRRSQDRAEEQDHPALGQTRHAAGGAEGSAHDLDLYLRCDLPSARQGRRPGAAALQHRGDEPAFGRDGGRRGADGTRRAAARPGRMALCRSAWWCRRTSPLMPLPAKCPELNPTENVWQFMRETGSQTACSRTAPISSNHPCCNAWNKLEGSVPGIVAGSVVAPRLPDAALRVALAVRAGGGGGAAGHGLLDLRWGAWRLPV